MADDGPWLLVGLGNPGPAYAGNRHNVGRMVLDVIAGREHAKFSSHRRSRSDIAETRVGGVRAVLAMPRSYMNEIGGPVTSLRDFFKVSPDRIVAIHDELDLDFGMLRLKLGGGDNGHNGLRSMRRSLGTGDFYRVRLGIGRPPGRQDPADFVLRDYSGAERKDLGVQLERAADATEMLLHDGLAAAQNAFND